MSDSILKRVAELDESLYYSLMILVVLGAITFVVAAIVNRIQSDTSLSLIYVVVSSVYLLVALLDITHHIIRCHMVGKFVVE